jgi:methyl-accepting chemotaxis protein
MMVLAGAFCFIPAGARFCLGMFVCGWAAPCTENSLQLLHWAPDTSFRTRTRHNPAGSPVSEQGRGFAVVADEVRALAERTTRATREIGEMIKAIQHETRSAVTAMEQGVKEVETGTAEAARSGEALQDILAQINNVVAEVNQIAVATEEQTAITGEISGNIHKITDVVQGTAKGAQESATAASQLAGLAEEMQRLVDRFRLAA